MTEDTERTEPIRVLLVDDEALLRAGIRLVLSHADDITVVGDAGTAADGIALAVQHRPDIVLMDIRMPGADGLAATEELAVRVPEAQVIVLTTFGEQEYLTRALAAGAAGFLLKDTGPGELIQAVRAVAAGEAILSPRVTRGLIEQFVHRDGARANEARRLISLLTDRERDVLLMVGHGLSNAEAGRKLYLGEGTVKTHVRHILTKLGCANRVQAAILAHEAGMLSPT